VGFQAERDPAVEEMAAEGTEAEDMVAADRVRPILAGAKCHRPVDLLVQQEARQTEAPRDAQRLAAITLGRRVNVEWAPREDVKSAAQAAPAIDIQRPAGISLVASSGFRPTRGCMG
jgi:hypothetical protein